MIPKEQYDQLYFYMDKRCFNAVQKGDDPIRLSSPRRYDTIQKVRKAALAKSKKEWSEIVTVSKRFPELVKNNSLTIYVFKGRTYMGFVEYNIHKRTDGGIHDFYDGMWYSANNPVNPSMILMDGSIGTRPIKKRRV